MFDDIKLPPAPLENEREFRRLQLKEIDNDIKQSTVDMADYYGIEMYHMIMNLQMLRQLNKLVALISELVEKSNNSSDSINHSRNGNNPG